MCAVLALLEPTLASAATPVAVIESQRVVVAGELIDLDGAGSLDGDGDALAFSWSLVQSPTGSLARIVDEDTPRALLHADLPGHYTVQLVVHDERHSSPARQLGD
jgi:hypothetical protein